MPQSPQRPYVPHRTPTRAQPAVSSADFALSRPFVPDAERLSEVVYESAVSYTPDTESSVPSIDSFLVTPRPAALPQPVDVYDEELSEESDELPPLEHFLDPLPSITDFSAIVSETQTENAADFPDKVAAADTPSGADTGWIETDWQRYDWQSIAALGETERAQAEASNAWATTDWEVPPPRMAESPRNPVDAIATALDKIAERIRNGDLAGTGDVADPATIAATLAALLGVKR
ncbi:MAG TPA: hypothetical protein VF105_11760 [Gemmatimonadaceae bacterium]